MNKHMAIILTQQKIDKKTPLRQLLYDYNFTVYYTESIGQFINIFTKVKEGFVFVDAQYYRFALLLKDAVEKVDAFKKYTIIFLGDNDNCRESLENKINIFSCRKNEIIKLTKKLLLEYSNKKRQENMSNNCVMPEDNIKSFLQEFGFSPRYKGFKYMVTAIRIGVTHQITNLRKEVYEKMVKTYNVTPVNIERNIRVLFTAVNQENLCNLLKTFIGFKPKRLTTKNFILIMIEIYKQRFENSVQPFARTLLNEMRKLEFGKFIE